MYEKYYVPIDCLANQQEEYEGGGTTKARMRIAAADQVWGWGGAPPVNST